MQQQLVPQYIPGMQSPQPQAAQVQPVAGPPSPGGQASGQSAVPQQWQQRMIAIAKPLEQIIPGYQIMASVLQDLVGAQASAETTDLMQAYHHAITHLSAALGAVRRFLCGEANQATLAALAFGVNRFAKAHGELRPHFDRVIASLTEEQRAVFTGLPQLLSNGENLVNQAGSTVQSTVGPQVWETVRSQVWDSVAPQAQSTPPVQQATQVQQAPQVQQALQAPQLQQAPQTQPAPQLQQAPQAQQAALIPQAPQAQPAPTPQQSPELQQQWPTTWPHQMPPSQTPQWWNQLPGGQQLQWPGAQPQSTGAGSSTAPDSTATP